MFSSQKIAIFISTDGMQFSHLSHYMVIGLDDYGKNNYRDFFKKKKVLKSRLLNMFIH